jgi:uncharacterized membrane protein
LTHAESPRLTIFSAGSSLVSIRKGLLNYEWKDLLAQKNKELKALARTEVGELEVRDASGQSKRERV